MVIIHHVAPVWGRGLKRAVLFGNVAAVKVAPVWGRGLKPCAAPEKSAHPRRPRVGAWIETAKKHPCKKYLYGRPRVGAWIETSKHLAL